MKSKKFVAVALAASIVLSGAYVSTAALSKDTTSVSAASVKVKTSLPYNEQYTTSIKIRNSASSGYDFYNIAWDREHNNSETYEYTDGGYLTFKILKQLLANDGNSLPSYKNTSLYRFDGWAYVYNADGTICGSDASGVVGADGKTFYEADGITPSDKTLGKVLTDDSPVLDMDGNPIVISDVYSINHYSAKIDGNISLANLHAVATYFETDEEAEASAAALAAEAEEKEEQDNRDGQLSRRLWRNYSGNNVRYWGKANKKDENGKTVRDENGNAVQVDTIYTGTKYPRAICVTNPKTGEFTRANYSDTKDKEGVEDYEGHTYYRINDMTYGVALKVANVNNINGVNSETKTIGDTKVTDMIALVYDVHWSTADRVIGLVNGKSAQVTLRFSGYDTSKYQPYVYHIVEKDGGGMKRVQIENLDVGKNDVTFYAKDFSPYVLVLVPKDRISTGSEYDNPPTGDASAIPVALLASASLSATGAVLLRRKRELGE